MILFSTIKHRDSRNALENYIGKKSFKNIVYIPTAANSEQGFGIWKEGKTYQIFLEYFPKLRVLELEFSNNESSKEIILNTNLLIVAGGVPAYLSYWLHRRDLVNLIKRRILEGMDYIGVSSGAMVCSETLNVATLFPNEALADKIPGLGLLDYEIWPHFKEEDEELMKEKFKDLKIQRLKDGDQIVIHN